MASTVWKGTLGFGLVSIPVRLYRAARAERVNLRELYRAAPRREAYQAEAYEPEEEEAPPPRPGRRGAQTPEAEAAPLMSSSTGDRRTEVPAPEDEAPVVPVRHAPVLPESSEPIAPREVVKGFEYQPDRYVVLEQEELRQLRARTSRDLEILEFVRLAEIDPLYFETSYYLGPDRDATKPYALLFEALRRSGYAGIGRLTMHGREHVAAIRPGRRGIILHTIFFEDEIRAAEEYTADVSEVTPKELQLAEAFIEALAAPFEPGKFKDTYRERLQALIQGKLAGGRVAGPPEPARKAAPVVDIMEALRKSLEKVRKPPAAETHAKPARRTRRA